jgi:hypothetical protein
MQGNPRDAARFLPFKIEGVLERKVDVSPAVDLYGVTPRACECPIELEYTLSRSESADLHGSAVVGRDSIEIEVKGIDQVFLAESHRCSTKRKQSLTADQMWRDITETEDTPLSAQGRTGRRRKRYASEM